MLADWAQIAAGGHEHQQESYKCKTIQMTSISMVIKIMFPELYISDQMFPDAKCSLNDAKCSLHDVQCSLIDAKCSLNDAKCSLDDVQCSLTDATSSMNDAKCSLNDVQGSLIDAKCYYEGDIVQGTFGNYVILGT